MAYVIGPKEIIREIKSGNIISVTAANNCPKTLMEKLKIEGVELKTFSGDQKALGNYIGRPFPVAVVGHTATKGQRGPASHLQRT